MNKYVRICPNCNKEIEYKSYSAWYNANKKQSLCRSCSYKQSTKRVADLSKLLDETYIAYYWMGFILADGSFVDNRLKFTLKKDDSEQVHRLGEFISYTGSYGKSSIKEGICCKDSIVVPQIMEKFGISYNKTYNPPKNLSNIKEDFLYCLLAGFIDGDGNIQHQNKRKDFMLKIKVHNSWIDILNIFSKLICNEEKAKINNQGYAELSITNTHVLQDLKKRISNYNLPLLKRKWDIIDMGFVSKYTTAEDLRNKVINLLKQNVKQQDIASICNTSPANVTRIKKLYESNK